MYTSFLVHFIEHAGDFEKCALNSHQKDQSWLVGWGRDRELSQRQQEKALEMAKAIKDTGLIKRSDEEIYQILTDKALELQKQTRVMVTAHKGPSATTQLLLEFDLFLVRLHTAFHLFQQTAMLNKKVKESPLVIFRSYLIFYLTNKEVYKRSLHIDYYKWTGVVWHFFYDDQLSAQKEALVRIYLFRDYLDTSFEGTRTQINALKTEETELLKTKEKEGYVPIPLGKVTAGFPITVCTYSPKSLREGCDMALSALPHAESTRSLSLQSPRAKALAVKTPPPSTPVDEVIEDVFYSDSEENEVKSTAGKSVVE